MSMSIFTAREAPEPLARQARRDGAARSVGRIDVLDNPAAAEKPWADLEARCPGSIYQARKFLLPWIAAFAGPLGITPMLVAAHDANGAPVAFLPFGVRRQGPFLVAEFLGGKDSNANIGLYAPNFHFAPDDLISLLKAAAAKARRSPDIFLLANQPEIWEGRANPLDIFPHQTSASFLHGSALASDPATFMKERLSKDAAKKLRAKRRKLDELGPVQHIVARDAASAKAVLDAFFAQKLARFREKNIDSVFETSESRAFTERAALDGLAEGRPAIELHALALGGRLIATYGGGGHRGQFHLMFNSFDADPQIGRCSPGDLLLQSILEQKCLEGFARFDLGVGEARYKDTWCDDHGLMFDSIMPVTLKGAFHARYESGRLSAKRWIKQSDWAWPLAKRLLGRG